MLRSVLVKCLLPLANVRPVCYNILYIIMHVIVQVVVHFELIKKPLVTFIIIGIFSPKMLILWFQVMIIIPLRSALVFVKLSILSNGNNV